MDSSVSISSAPARSSPEGGVPPAAQKPAPERPHSHTHQHTHKALDQYRLQLYNYALNIERFRCPSYTSAAAMAAAAAFASTGSRGQSESSTEPGVPDATAAPDASMYGLVAAAAAAASGQGGRPHGPVAYPAGQPFSRSPHSMALSMSLFPARGIFQPEEPKPQHSYIGLIAMAILSAPDAKLVLSDIYQYILDHYPYFRSRGPGWRNSIRHNLSLNDCFVKSGRSANGKGHYWAVHPANLEDFRKGDFRRRKAQRKVRRHMGLSVDDAGADSPSPPPLELTPPPPAGLVQPVAAHPFAAAHHLAAAAAFGYLQQQHHHHHHQRLAAFQQHHHNHQPQPHHYFGGGFMPRYVANFHQPADGQLAGFEHPPAAALPLPQPPYPAAAEPPPAKLASATLTTRTQISNLFSQTTRKRQFDVASLLADDDEDADAVGRADASASASSPDPAAAGKECCQTITIIDNVEESDVEGELTTTTTEHTTVITKLSVQRQYQFRHQFQKRHKRGQSVRLKSAELELEEQQDIDVEASDIDDGDQDGYLTASDNDRSEESCDHAPEIRLGPTGEQDARGYADTAHGLPARSVKSAQSPSEPVGVGASGVALQEPLSRHPLRSAMDAVDTQIFGRYYGTYMAATRQSGPAPPEPCLAKSVHPPYLPAEQEHRQHYQPPPPPQQQQHEHPFADFKHGRGELP